MTDSSTQRKYPENTFTDGLVSVIMPMHNSSCFLREAIESVQAQTYTNWEMIIVDDCSSDNTPQIVSTLAQQDKRIKCYRLAQNSGAAVARTTAMQQAQGQYMAFLDSDDLWYPQKLEKQLAFMQATGHAFTCTAYEQIDEAGNPLKRVVKSIAKTSYNRLLLDCPVGNSTVMYSVEKMGKFVVPNIRKRNDDALWLAMLKKEAYIWGIAEVLMQYRIRPNSISSNKLQVVQYHWKLYREIEHLSVPRSLFHIGYWGMIKILRIK